MQLNKCVRCGCFFMSDANVCPSCQAKDNIEINQLKNFLEEVDPSASIEEISYNTGILQKNLHRFFQSDDFIANANEPHYFE